ncbi:high molecular weight rhoptry protein 3 [Plasmodium gonderi]|uniref:High molecular weight rhoptry protein 3 n=1 Tax=Plasmodium gonderi TaxID=77519 RepID=A0A1Y1JEN8_PLAGO|nr:high molecular weight rhoptry protein 3 [Plasmodium gonderi]GAW80118.1 high molecular weight rhoptry protein 3 [Plasmodium gonderi]
MQRKLFVTLFTTCLVTLPSILVHGKEYFSGFVHKKLKNLLQCNFVAYYNIGNNGPDPNSFLDFVGEPEQFYWFIEHYLSVPFKIPKHLKNNKIHNFSSCKNRSWVSEFLRKYEEPDIYELMKFLDKEQKLYFSQNFENIEPVAKYTSFSFKEFHKYCILPPLIETNIKKKDKGGFLSYQLNEEEYKIYLNSLGSPISALKNVYSHMEDGERKSLLMNIVEMEDSNEVLVNCPVYDLKLHYNKDCGSEPNILKCLDNYIKKLCKRRIAKREHGTFCDHLLFLFDALKEPYVENFKKFLKRNDVHLVKPQSVWGVPLFNTYKPRDIKDPKKNVPADVFKVLSSKNKLFLSFVDEIPNNPYYVEESQPLVKLSSFTSSIFDKLHRFFQIFKKQGKAISPVSVKELSHNISDFSFKRDTSDIECKNVKKSLNLDLEVEVAKGVAAEKICKIIEKYVLTKENKGKTLKGEFMLQLDDVHKGFRLECVLLSTHVEGYNIIRQLLNMESMLSLTRYTSLYLHKFFKTVTSLKGNFLYENANAIKYAQSCGTAVLHVPAVLYRRNIYLSETFLSLYLGLSNLVSSNPSSPFFEYAIIEFLVSYFNKGSEKFILYFISIMSVLYINIYYYEQLYCYHNEHFELLRSKMIHPNVANRILENISMLIKSPRYAKMYALYTKFDDEVIFNKEKVFEILYSFDQFLSSADAQKKAKMQNISDDLVDLDTTSDGIGFRKEDIFFESENIGSMESAGEETDEDLEGIDKNQQKKITEYLSMIPEGESANLDNKNKELELELYKYIGPINNNTTEVGTISSHSPSASSHEGLDAEEGSDVTSSVQDVKEKTGQMGKDFKRMKGKSSSQFRKGTDSYESLTSLGQISSGEFSNEDKGSNTNISPEEETPEQEM